MGITGKQKKNYGLLNTVPVKWCENAKLQRTINPILP
jgi:hypothetical protein